MEASKFPEARFEGTLKKTSENKYMIIGTILIHDYEHRIQFPAEIIMSKHSCTVSTSFTLMYPDYEITVPAKKSKHLSREVIVTIKGKIPVDK